MTVAMIAGYITAITTFTRSVLLEARKIIPASPAAPEQDEAETKQGSEPAGSDASASDPGNQPPY